MQVRLTLLIGLSAVLAVIAVSALLAPVPPAGERTDGGAAPAREAASPTPVPTELEPAPGRPFVLSAARTGQVVELPAGRETRIEVHASEPVSVQLGDDGPIELAEPGTPAEFPVYGDPSAEGPIRLLDPDREIGRVELAG